MTIAVATSTLDLLSLLPMEGGLEPGDPRFVDATPMRNGRNLASMLLARLQSPGAAQMLLLGQRGCGKTTELKRAAQHLRSQRFFVVEVDVTKDLCRTDVQPGEISVLMVLRLLHGLREAGCTVSHQALAPLHQWLAEHVTPVCDDFLASDTVLADDPVAIEVLLQAIVSSFRSRSTYAPALRDRIQSTYAIFADAFNTLVSSVEQQLAQHGTARRVVFLVDGTDHLLQTDRDRIFITEARRKLSLRMLAVYTVISDIRYDEQLLANWDTSLVLNSLDVQAPDGAAREDVLAVLREMVLRRCGPGMFVDPQDIDRLGLASGGHPGSLMQLLRLCCELAGEDHVDSKTVDMALQQMTSEYRRFLEPADYRLLQACDRDEATAGETKRTCRLLVNLALLDHAGNTAGQHRLRSHPVVRHLEGYQLAARQARAAAPQP